jgi:probable rRNA maturation factor
MVGTGYEMEKRLPTEQIFVANAHPTLQVDTERLQTVASEVLQKENRCRGRVNIILATDRDLKSLNNRYLGRNHPTDVMAFSMGGDEPPEVKHQVVGEIYVSLDRAQLQAQEYQVTFAKEVDRLVIHGLLHLCGYDHERVDEADAMRTREDHFLEGAR